MQANAPKELSHVSSWMDSNLRRSSRGYTRLRRISGLDGWTVVRVRSSHIDRPDLRTTVDLRHPERCTTGLSGAIETVQSGNVDDSILGTTVSRCYWKEWTTGVQFPSFEFDVAGFKGYRSGVGHTNSDKKCNN